MMAHPLPPGNCRRAGEHPSACPSWLWRAIVCERLKQAEESPMWMEEAHALADLLAKLLELFGVAIIIGGSVLATLNFVRHGAGGGSWREAYDLYRSNLGRGILLGLELLVGADIISTITAPL